MQYRHQFIVSAPLSAVSEFHQNANSLRAITPLPIRIHMNHLADMLTNRDRMDFTMWLGPLPIHWLAEMNNTEANGFIDKQIEGPFQSWVHQHTFIALDETNTEVRDEIQASIQRHPFFAVIGLGMWLGLPLLFAYRAWKTRKILAQPACGCVHA